jgi:Ulp1 family protease
MVAKFFSKLFCCFFKRMEKERIEKELAEKFSHQLHLESNKINIFEQEDAEIDEFPGEFFFFSSLFKIKIKRIFIKQKSSYSQDFTDEQKECIKNAFIPNPPGEVLASGFALDITRRDIQTLKGTNWLNDEVINFYMNLIMERSSSSNSDNNNNKGNSYSNQAKVYAFSTFFYPKLIKDGYNSLRRWTKKVDLFTYNLVLVPIHLGVHWTLAVIDFDCKEIKYYDSMNGNNGECLNALRNYLKDEYADKKAGAQYDISSWNCLPCR